MSLARMVASITNTCVFVGVCAIWKLPGVDSAYSTTASRSSRHTSIASGAILRGGGAVSLAGELELKAAAGCIQVVGFDNFSTEIAHPPPRPLLDRNVEVSECPATIASRRLSAQPSVAVFRGGISALLSGRSVTVSGTPKHVLGFHEGAYG
eukprot:3644142-Rhodomonas_salina.6